MDTPAVRDAALLLLRIVLGTVFIAHGWDKLVFTGITETTGQFSAWGIPQPKLSAWLVTGSELLGGALLVVGLLTTFVAGLLALLMVAAIWFVHLDSGFFTTTGGLEYPIVLTAALVMVVVFGSGRVSLDGVLSK
ncbi:MAG: DoxX family protein [Corynebacterium sp.]|uniref:DoxX family protein n=1 Tax=Corynebacterium sp. TaxID=1720 RepID=UPI0026E0E17E|nr:DoxX family protein [Corynebacterium sp.]MDO5669622.1 DoxX family protein [Corynebacterium sp.]